MRSTDDLDEVGVDQVLERAELSIHRDLQGCADLLDQVESWCVDRRDLARSARSALLRGRVALGVGETGQALTAFRRARHHWWALGNVIEACLAELACAGVKVQVGEFEAARRDIHGVRELCNSSVPLDETLTSRAHALINAHLGDAHAGLGEVTEALRHYDLADNVFHAIGEATGVAAVHRSRGRTYLTLGMAHRAVAELERARQIWEESGWTHEALSVVPLLAVARARTGRIPHALELLERSAAELADVTAHRGAHDLSRAQVLLLAGFHGEALAAAQSAERSLTDADAVIDAAQARLVSAEALMGLTKPEAAAVEYLVAERLFTACGARIELTWAWLGQGELALTRNDPAQAGERATSVVLAGLDATAAQPVVQAHLLAARADQDAAVEQLDRARELAIGSGIPELRLQVALARCRHLRVSGDLDRAIEELRAAAATGNRVLGVTGAVADGFSQGIMTDIGQELIEALLERDDYRSRKEAWQRVHAAKVSMLRGLSRPEGGADVQLPAVPVRAMVEYFVGAEDITAFVVRDGQVDVRRLWGAVAPTRRLVRAWHQECTLMAAPGRPVSARSAALDGLYETLMSPVADLLADLDEELQVIGHLHLHAVPFDALLDAGGPWHDQLGAGGDETDDDTPEAPGAAPAPTTLVLAVPDTAAPSIRAEAEMIFTTVPDAHVLVGGAASRAGLRQYAGQVELIHLACHGVFRSTNPLASALQLGDGWLTAQDVLDEDLGLRGATVVLSACSAGRGADEVPDPLGLTWACLAAGAQSVIAALWPVDDAVTAQLMARFYRDLARGMDPEAALSRARRAVARHHPHPYFWAAFRCFTSPDEAVQVWTRRRQQWRGLSDVG